MDSLSRHMKGLSLKRPKKAIGIHGLTLGLGQMGLRSTWNLPKIKQVALENKRKFFIAAHGGYSETIKKFTVPEGVFIIFLATAATFYYHPRFNDPVSEFMTKRSNIRLLLQGEINDENLPFYLKGWKTRFYGPGDTCKDVHLELFDKEAHGMGIHNLPFVSKNQIMEIAGIWNGYKTNLSDIVNKVKGVYFVACCRKTGPSRPHPIYTTIGAYRGDLNTRETDKSASQTLLKRRALNSPIVRSAKKRRVSSVPRTN